MTWRAVSNYTFVCAIGFSWLAAVLLALSTSMGFEFEGSYEHRFFVVDKTIYYYMTHGLSIFFVVISGLAALLNKNYRVMPSNSVIAFMIMQVFGFGWFISVYCFSELYTLKDAVGSTGFMVWLSTILVFSAVDPKAMRMIERKLPIIVYVTLAIFILGILFNEYVRIPGASKELRLYLILWWFAAWFFLHERRNTFFWVMMRQVPYMILLLGSLYIQSRSWLLLTLALIVLRRMYIVDIYSPRMKVFMNIVNAIIAMIGFLGMVLFFGDILIEASNGFIDRIFEDSRSNQYQYFFESVSPSDLILGLGPEATWYWPGRGEYQFFDNGVLWMLFIGGMPIAFSYLYFIITPGFLAVRRLNYSKNDLSVATLIVLYLLMLLGLATYTSPSVSIQSFIMYMFVGNCYWLLMNNKEIEYEKNMQR